MIPDVSFTIVLRADFFTNFDSLMPDKMDQIIELFEKHLIQNALSKTGGHRQSSASLLGISRKNLHNKMAKYKMFEKSKNTAPPTQSIKDNL